MHSSRLSFWAVVADYIQEVFAMTVLFKEEAPDDPVNKTLMASPIH